MENSGVNSSTQPMAPVLPMFSMDIVRRVDAHVATCTARGRFTVVRDVASRTVVSLDSTCDGRQMERAIAP